MNKENKVTLAILNITSWVGYSIGAEHLYGKLILSTEPKVTIDNINEYAVKYLGDEIELFRNMTLKEAQALDIKDGGSIKEKRWYRDNKETNRFDTFEQVVNAGIEKWKGLKLDCPFISVYEGEIYSANKHEQSETVIMQPELIKRID